MKTIFFLIIILSLWLITCQNEPSKQIPKNFEVVLYEEDFGRVELMKGMIIRNVDGTDQKVRFSLTPKEKLAIYNAILSNGLLELPEIYKPKRDCHWLHQTYYEMKIFHLNKVRSINISNCKYGFFENFKVQRCMTVVDTIMMIVQDKDEVKKIPKSQGLIM